MKEQPKLCIFKIVLLNTKLRLQITQKVMYEKVYVHEITAVNLSEIYFLKNAKKTCISNNRDLNLDWLNLLVLQQKHIVWENG